ncbi:MAG: signal peptidase II [Candidatus Shapirobacteria bacterium]|jgi:lipoprotein signal peptidase
MALNCGIAFGLQIPYLVAITSIIWLLIVMGALKYRKTGWWLMVVGGAGNLWQRWLTGCVVDNLRIPIIGGYNNWWDWLVVAGGLLIIVDTWKQNRK